MIVNGYIYICSGKIQEIEKECILIIDRKTNTITLERVTSKVSVRNTREKDDKTHDFPVMRTLDKPAVKLVMPVGSCFWPSTA